MSGLPCAHLALLIAFCIYGEYSLLNCEKLRANSKFRTTEWRGRPGGILSQVFFRGSPNFALSVFALAVEGWIFFSAVNSVTPQTVLNMGFGSSAWKISVRQLSYNIVSLAGVLPIT